jgi:glutamate formiminotransferase / formiminotetrahydrofolate cyclodeaminase
MRRLIECVPNFSEGRDAAIIGQITDAIESVEGIRLLNIDRGLGANRTVVTFIGEPLQVVEAAFLAIQRASELIDMRLHSGEHPRIGATDVCPLIPICGITMEETVELARNLAQRVGNELNIPVYCYEYAAFTEVRRSLAHCRSGEYEGLKEKMERAEWQPDFGPFGFNAGAGATIIGARNFLIAYNVNLNTASVELAKSIASEVRELGKFKFQKDPSTRKVLRDEKGEPLKQPGGLPKVRAIGWHIQEYGRAQVSMNLMDMHITPMHKAFEEVKKKAQGKGADVTGSELIGLVPLEAMLEAGIYFRKKNDLSLDVSQKDLIETAIESLGLNDVAPFNPDKKIIEYLLDLQN